MKSLLCALLCLLASVYGVAQTPGFDKATPSLALFLQQRQMGDGQSVQSKSFGEQNDAIGVLVSFSDAAPVAKWLEMRGLEVRTMLEHSLTVTLPVDSLSQLMALPQVQAVSAMNYRRPSLDKVRKSTNADIVLDGTGLYAPYTGKGVIVGVIDQGFDYAHPAFRKADGTSRILAAWQSESGKSHKALTTSSDILKAGNDGIENATHATNVLSIAAGGRDHEGISYYGLAPDADIVVVPCVNLDDDEVIDGINYISKVASQHGEPFVINMSFGTMDTPHNGKGVFAKSVDELSGKGAILVAAVGNDGNETFHTELNFTSSANTRYLYLLNIGKDMSLRFYSRGTKAFDVTYYIYNKATQTLEQKNSAWLRSHNCSIQEGLDKDLNQYGHFVTIDVANAFANYRGSNYCMAFAVKGSAGETIDAWVCDYENEFGPALSSDPRFDQVPDGYYCISSPADAESVVSVTAHAVRSQFTNMDGKTYYSASAIINGHADYASLGPLVGEAVVKPTVSAPGTYVISSLFDNNRKYSGSSASKIYIVDKVDYDNSTYYYGVSNGTSMAAPVVTGAVALWLEASPDLTPQQVQDIIKRTSVKDSFTGIVPNATWGYGKLDVYEGLKEALLISSIPSVRNSDAPFTLQAYADSWQVLLNTDEDYAEARLINLNGSVVWNHRVNRPMRGTDFTVPTGTLPKGLYILQLSSTNHKQTQKIVVR